MVAQAVVVQVMVQVAHNLGVLAAQVHKVAMVDMVGNLVRVQQVAVAVVLAQTAQMQVCRKAAQVVMELPIHIQVHL
jgi:hypothetical protein